jgi:hypothetical protein
LPDHSARCDVIRHQHASVAAENNQSFMHDLHTGVTPGVTKTLAQALSLQTKYISFKLNVLLTVHHSIPVFLVKAT